MKKTRLTHSFGGQRKWNTDDDGFLRCNTTVLKSCVLDYAPSELGDDIPSHLLSQQFIKLFVPLDELIDVDSLKTLEGKPIVLGHTWQSAGNISSVGNVAGAPICKNGYLFADILVNDPKTIDSITTCEDNSKLTEQSAGYECVVDWTPGVTPDGTPYDGVQRNIDYNHVALLRDGEGRAGADVRILNEAKRGKLMEFVKIKVRNSYVRVCNEDAPALEKEMDGVDKEIANAIDPSDLKDSMDRLSELNAAKDKLDGERDTLIEQVSALQAQIAELTSDDNMADKVDQAVDTQNAASSIINACSLTSDSERRVGNKLKKHVVELHRLKNSLPALSQDRLANEQYIDGVFDMLRIECEAKKSVTGANVVQLQNQSTDVTEGATSEREANFMRAQDARKKMADRLNSIGGKK